MIRFSFRCAFIFLILCFGFACKHKATDIKDESQRRSKSLDLYLPSDLEATLWAESPMFYNPTNMDVDIRGRIWVTEAVNYRNYNNDSTRFYHHHKGDRVMILEDTNRDGRADRSRVFVQDPDLVSPLGIAVIGNKVIVSCSPNLIIYTDNDGDDQPDSKEILLTGFGGKDHDHSLHAVYAGADGKWYFNTGNAGPHQVNDKSGWTLRSGSIYTGGSPYNKENSGNRRSDDGKLWVGGLALRVNPDGTGLKVLAHNFRNAYEVIPDSYGNLWQNDNDDQVVTCRTSWLMEGGNAGYFSSDGTRYWQADQRPGQDIFTAHWHQDDPGVMPAGDRSGAGAPTGIVVNESEALGEKYLGLLLSADAGRNTIFGYHPALKYSGYDLGIRSNFISSLQSDNPGYVWNDSAQNVDREKWFRPSDVTIGTDGAMYVADWYDPVVGGHQIQDTIGYGRIYRITPKNKKLAIPVININTTEGQVAAFKSPAINVRNQGYERLKEKGEASVDLLRPLLDDQNPYIRARTIWLLSRLGQKGKSIVVNALGHQDARLRATAYRALRQTEPDIFGYASRIVNDTSAFVRREVAISLAGLSYEKIKPLLLQLVQGYSAQDRWYLETVGLLLEGHEEDIYPSILKLLGDGKPPSNWTTRMVDFAWRLHPKSAVEHLVARARDSSLLDGEREQAITALGFIKDTAAANAMSELSRSVEKRTAEQAAYWLSFRQSNDWSELLDWSKIQFNPAYERKLAQMKVKMQIALDEKQSEGERRRQINQMAMDSIGGQILIGMAADKKIPATLMPFIEQKIFSNPNSTVRVQATRYFNRPGTQRTYPIEIISKMSSSPADGEIVFMKFCASCHKFNDSKASVGPDLNGIGRKFDKAGLLDAIINPSAAIVFGYEPWLVNTKDGESIYGFLISDNPKAVVVRDVVGQQHVIPAGKIASKRKQDQSLMPDPVSNGLTEQNLADVVSFLLKQNSKKKQSPY